MIRSIEKQNFSHTVKQIHKEMRNTLDDPMTQHLAKISEYAEQLKSRQPNKKASGKLLAPVQNRRDQFQTTLHDTSNYQVSS